MKIPVVVIPELAGSSQVAADATGKLIPGTGAGGTAAQIPAPAFSVYNGTGVAIAAATYTKLTFPTVDAGSSSWWDAANNRFTPQRAGWYRLSAMVDWADGGQGILVIKNRTVSDVRGSGTGGIVGTGLFYFNGTTDFAEVQVYGSTAFTLYNYRFEGEAVDGPAAVVATALGAFSAVAAANQAAPAAATWAKLVCPTEEYDPSNWYDATTSRYTPQQAGMYRISASAYFLSAHAGALAVFKNGTQLSGKILSDSGAAAVNGLSGTADVYLNGTTDYVEVFFNEPSSPTGLLARADLTFIQGEFVGVATPASGGIPVVNVLPTTNLVDGQEVYLRVDTAGTYGGPYRWRCQYDATLASNKWHVLEGQPLRASVATVESTASNVYVNLATAGPSIAAPFAGVYKADFGCSIEAALTSGWRGRVSPIGADSASAFASGSGATGSPSAGSSVESSTVVTRTAGQVTTLTHRSDASNSIAFGQRFLEMKPIRIGG